LTYSLQTNKKFLSEKTNPHNNFCYRCFELTNELFSNDNNEKFRIKNCFAFTLYFGTDKSRKSSSVQLWTSISNANFRHFSKTNLIRNTAKPILELKIAFFKYNKTDLFHNSKFHIQNHLKPFVEEVRFSKIYITKGLKSH